MVRRFIQLWLFTLLVITTANAAELTATVDRTQLRLNEPLLFTLSLINSDTRLRAEGVNPNVDLTLLSNNFDIGKPEASNNYNIYRGEGRSTSTIKVELFAKRSGKLTIPAFEVDGLKSNVISVNVLPKSASEAEEIFATSGSNVKSAWAGQQLVVYIDLYHRVELASASMGSGLESEPTMIDLLPSWELPQASRKEKRKGYEYDVERIAWSVFPNQAGPFRVILPDLWITTKAGRKVRMPSQTLNFDIKALPAGLPKGIIIGKPELSAPPPPQDFKQYELSQWTLTLKAPVAVTTLPKFLPGIQLPEGLKLYPDPARYSTEKKNTGITDIADYTLSIMPLHKGEFELPTIRVPYFDPDNGKAALVGIPGTKISVAAGTVPQPQSTLADTASGSTTATNEDGSTSIDIWQISTIVLALLWLTTLYLWRRQPTQTAAPVKPAPATVIPIKDKRHPLQQQLLTAMHSKTLEEGLQQWLQHQPDDRVVLDAVRAVQRFCYGHGDESEAEIESKVRAAVELIERMPVRNDSVAVDRWKAESFSRN
jgi:hypothetical protein